MQTTNLYALTDPDGKIRYVGKTGKAIELRRAEHLVEARGNRHTCHRLKWLRKLLSEGFVPGVILLGAVEGDGSREEVAWIQYFRDEGVALCNGTKGGDGTPGREVSAVTRQKLSSARKGKPQTWVRTAETIERMRESAKVRCARLLAEGQTHGIMPTDYVCSEETRKKISTALIGRTFSIAHRERLREAHLGKTPSAETRAKMSLVHRGRKHSEETKEKCRQAHLGRVVSEESRRRMRESALRRWAKPQ